MAATRRELTSKRATPVPGAVAITSEKRGGGVCAGTTRHIAAPAIRQTRPAARDLAPHRAVQADRRLVAAKAAPVTAADTAARGEDGVWCKQRLHLLGRAGRVCGPGSGRRGSGPRGRGAEWWDPDAAERGAPSAADGVLCSAAGGGGGGAGQPRAPPPRQPHESDNEEVKVKKEEQTLGQLRDQLTRVPAPGPRAARVLIKIEDSTSAKDMDGVGDAEQAEAAEEVEEQQEEQTNVKAGAGAVAPASQRARLPPGSYADLVVERDTDNEDEEEEEEDDDEEEEEEEEDEDEDEEDDDEDEEEEEEQEGEGEEEGINVDGEADGRRSSQVAGVAWHRIKKKWAARPTVNGKRVHLGYHATVEAAALAVDKYVKDGVDPVKHRGVRTSQFMGVCWIIRDGTWQARCNGENLGYHATEEAAAQAYNNYVENGVIPLKHRSGTSQFKGVGWDKYSGKWKARCKGKTVGYHATEEAAARAYNKEAERIGHVDLNVIPPAGDTDDGSNTTAATGIAAASLALPGPVAPERVHAGTGSKGAAPNTSAPQKTKTLGLYTSAGAGVGAPAAAAAQPASAAPAKAASREAASKACIEADALVDLDVTPPAGHADGGSNTSAAAAALPNPAAPARAHAGAGSKRAAQTTLAPQQTKKTRLDTPAGVGAAAVAGANEAAAAPAKVTEQVAALEARIKAEKAKTKVAEGKVVVAEAQAAIEKAKAALSEMQFAAHVAEQTAAEAEHKVAL